MTNLIKIVLSLGVIFGCHPAFAATSPLAVGFIPPVQFPPSDFDVTGLRLSLLVGKHRTMTGIDVGLIGNVTDVEFAGLAISGGFNRSFGPTTIIGLQLAGLANINTQKTSVYGFQLAAVNSNTAESKIAGFQLGLVNLSQNTTIGGVQVGVYNVAREVYGLQIGLVNRATNLHGLQIGLVNFHEQGVFAVCPIINFGF